MEDKKQSFMDQLNLFFVGAVIGAIIGACFGMNVYKGKSIKAEKKKQKRTKNTINVLRRF